jgi:hypothetical protein
MHRCDLSCFLQNNGPHEECAKYGAGEWLAAGAVEQYASQTTFSTPRTLTCRKVSATWPVLFFAFRLLRGAGINFER